MDIKFPEGFNVKENGEMYLNEDTYQNKLQISVVIIAGKQNRYLGSHITANYHDFINTMTAKRNHYENTINKGLIKVSIYVKSIMLNDRIEVFHGVFNDDLINTLTGIINNK